MKHPTIRPAERRSLRRIAVFLTLTALALGVAAATPALAQTTQYRVIFDATWTAETHPQDYPANPHFSGLVGGVHDGSVSFWSEGAPASLGIQRMAEWGSQPPLLAEVQTAIDGGRALATISDTPLWTVPGTTFVDFAATPDFPLVSLVAMIAPSPDWFVGVSGLDLRPGGEWVDQLVVDLYAFDAGTDSGQNYTSGDNPTSPHVPVFAINGGPFTAGVPLGTFTFIRMYTSPVPRAPAFSTSAYPNPFNPRVTIAWELPAAGRLAIDIFDVKGRRVRSLLDRSAAAGPGHTVWQGRDAAGRPLVSGLYFARIRHPAGEVVRRLTLLE